MVNLLKNENKVKIDEVSNGISFLREWRNLTNYLSESGYEVLDENNFHLEIENTLILFNLTFTTVNGASFSNIQEIISYLGYEYN